MGKRRPILSRNTSNPFFTAGASSISGIIYLLRVSTASWKPTGTGMVTSGPAVRSMTWRISQTSLCTWPMMRFRRSLSIMENMRLATKFLMPTSRGTWTRPILIKNIPSSLRSFKRWSRLPPNLSMHLSHSSTLSVKIITLSSLEWILWSTLSSSLTWLKSTPTLALRYPARSSRG